MSRVDEVPRLIRTHSRVKDVELVGSRARREPGPLSDWDFAVVSDDVSGVVNDLPDLLASLEPLAFVPDPLARHVVIAILLPGPMKADLIFNKPHSPEQPWAVNAQSLTRIDAHFWDWIFWLAGKQLKGEAALVREQLVLLHDHLLEPLGISSVPSSIAEATHAYIVGRAECEERFKVLVPRRLESAFVPVFVEKA